MCLRSEASDDTKNGEEGTDASHAPGTGGEEGGTRQEGEESGLWSGPLGQ